MMSGAGDGRYDTRWVGRMPLARRLLRFIMFRPFIVFAAYFVLVSMLAVVPDPRTTARLSLVAAPWVFTFMLLLHMPVIGAAFRGFRLLPDVRVNHALEHGTIFFLSRRCGKRFKIGGKAESDGFRLNGMPSIDLIAPAFEDLRSALARGETRPVISRHCGSMIVTAQALSAILLTAAAVAFLVFDYRQRTRVVLLGLVLLVYVALRHGLGLLLQRRWFLSLDFTHAELRSIKQVKPRGFLERQPVYFVRTVVQ